MEILAFALGFKGVSAIAGIFLVAGGYLGYKYGDKVESKASSDVSKASQAVSNLEKKL